MRNTLSKCGISKSNPFCAVLRELRYSASANGKRVEITRAFSSNKASNSGRLIDARAVSAFGHNEEGTGHPSGPNSREGASGIGESVSSSNGAAASDATIVEDPLFSSRKAAAAEDDSSSGYCSSTESVHWAIYPS